MWSELMHTEIPILGLVIRAAVIYLAVLILLRISGKRQMGQMSATEFVAILLISNAVQNSMNGGDNSVMGGLVLAAVLIALSTAISYLTFRSRFFSSVFEGSPTILIRHGKIIPGNLYKERLSEAELHILLRKQGIHDLKIISSGILEADGTLSIEKMTDSASATNPPMP